MKLIVFLVICGFNCCNAVFQGTCNYRQRFLNTFIIARTDVCPKEPNMQQNKIYILYDVNPSEGFNLQRDVYIRLAVFVRQIKKQQKLYKNVQLVLPPWSRLYHWKSKHLLQEDISWRAFFDIESLQRYAPVLDFSDFLKEIKNFGLPESPKVVVHHIYQLLPFEEMYENGVFHDKIELWHDCKKENYFHSNFLSLKKQILIIEDKTCVHFQGSVNLLEHIIRKALSNDTKYEPKVFLFLNAEIVLHNQWGNRDFWSARRSMRFAPALVAIAKEFRKFKLKSNDVNDKVQRPPMWEYEKPYRAAVGGPYLCAHLRRGDFLHGRENTTPTLRSAAMQIKNKLRELNLTTVFIATDATAFEKKNMKTYLQHTTVVYFAPESLEQKVYIKDGGIAIVDQIICSHARYFIGTYESTFTYRIYEEREILGFRKDATFNTFCKSETLQKCSKNSVWPIVY